LSAALGTPGDTVRRHLYQLDMVRRNCHKVPHDLTAEQAQRHKTICQELLTNPMDERFLKRIITCDEKWVYYKNPDLRKQWIKKGEAPLQVPKRARFERKVMLSVWWNFEGIIHFELIPDGRAIDSNLYSQQLERVHAVLSERYPALINRHRVLLQQGCILRIERGKKLTN
jgi:histone-lysine N-methyltransferase SETMAR